MIAVALVLFAQAQPGTTCWGYGCGDPAAAPPQQPTPQQPTPQQPTPQQPTPPVPAIVATAPPPVGTIDPPDPMKPSTKLELGGTYRSLLGYGGAALDTRFAVGARSRNIGHYFAGGFFWGETGEHLRTYGASGGYNVEFYLDLVRLGLGVEATLLWVRRASLDSRLFAPGVGVFAHGGLDLVRFDETGRRAMYLDLRVQGSAYEGGGTLWGPTGSIGFRI